MEETYFPQGAASGTAQSLIFLQSLLIWKVIQTSIFVALHVTSSGTSMSLLYWGDQNWTALQMCLTYVFKIIKYNNIRQII